MTPSSADRNISPVDFDDYSAAYDAALNEGLNVTGESKDYFARERIRWLHSCLQELSEQPHGVMDYGCGDGSSSPLLLSLTKEGFVLGVDTSENLLDLARNNHASQRSKFGRIHDHQPKETLDLVYCNGVFHHIPPAERASAIDYIWKSLRPGGIFALWENNPWNPGTRYVMSRIPFDREAMTLTPPEATFLLKKAGFNVLRCDSMFYFPRQLKFLRWIEFYLRKLPLGGQYQLLCRKS